MKNTFDVAEENLGYKFYKDLRKNTNFTKALDEWNG